VQVPPNGHTHASRAAEVERKLSNLMADFAPAGSSLNRDGSAAAISSPGVSAVFARGSVLLRAQGITPEVVVATTVRRRSIGKPTFLYFVKDCAYLCEVFIA
jgi:hypothetical protein